MNVSVSLITFCILLALSSMLSSQAAPDGTYDSAPPPRLHLRILPLGDSITLCCHHCGVSPVILPRKYRISNAEPNRPWEGYIKQLYRLLEHQGFSSPTSSPQGGTTAPNMSTGGVGGFHGSFTFEGRVRSCMMNSTPPSQGRVDTTDWSVRYEAYYGITSGGLLRDKLDGALRGFYRGDEEGFLLETPPSTPPNTAHPEVTINVILLHIGTNDLIQPKLTNRVSGAVSNVREMLARIRSAAAISSPSQNSRRHRVVNVVIVSRLSPMQFCLIGGDRLAPALSKKAHRWRDYNTALAEMVEHQEGFIPSNGTTDALLSSSSSLGSDLKILMVDPNTAAASMSSHSVCGAGVSEGGGVLTRPFEMPPLDPRKHLHGDGLHLNPKGERVLATTYYSGIQRVLRSFLSLSKQLAPPRFHVELNCEKGPHRRSQQDVPTLLEDGNGRHHQHTDPPQTSSHPGAKHDGLPKEDVYLSVHHFQPPTDDVFIDPPSSVIAVVVLTSAVVVYLIVKRRRRLVMNRNQRIPY